MDGDSYPVRTTDGVRDLWPHHGHTLPHEHILLDLRVWWEGPGDWRDLDPTGQDLLPETQDAVSRRPQGVTRENLVLADSYLAAKELREARASGCQLLVDLTCQGLHPQPHQARIAAQLAGLDIVLGVGRYLGPTLDKAERHIDAQTLAARWIHQANDGIDGLLPGIIGEIGTSEAITSDEVTSLRAAAWTQQTTGLAINVHVHPYARQALHALQILDNEGADLSRVVISHCDGELDLRWLQRVLDTSCYAEFDQFGTGPHRLIQGRGYPSDHDRIRALAELCDRGYAERLLLSHDICMRSSLRHNGGCGYAHLAEAVAPLLIRTVGEQTVHQLMNVNPLRLLAVNR